LKTLGGDDQARLWRGSHVETGDAAHVRCSRNQVPGPSKEPCRAVGTDASESCGHGDGTGHRACCRMRRGRQRIEGIQGTEVAVGRWRKPAAPATRGGLPRLAVRRVRQREGKRQGREMGGIPRASGGAGRSSDSPQHDQVPASRRRGLPTDTRPPGRPPERHLPGGEPIHAGCRFHRNACGMFSLPEGYSGLLP
jgi:hypothetical protein